MGLKFEASAPIDMLSLNFSKMISGVPTTTTSTKFELRYSGGYRDVFEGRGLKYDNNDVPTGGTVHEFTEYLGKKELFQISDMSVSAKAVAKAAFTQDTADDIAIIIKEMSGADRVLGSKGSDTLFAEGGNDLINGRGGDDVILSGPGADVMTGGAGADGFVFIDVGHSTDAVLDIITDFSNGDTIYLANIGTVSFIGTADFSGAAGEVRYAISGNNTIVSGDFDGDAVAEFSVRLKGVFALTSDDFTP